MVITIIKVPSLRGISIKADDLSTEIMIRNGKETIKTLETIMINLRRPKKSPMKDMRSMRDLIINLLRKKSNHNSKPQNLKREEL